MTVMANSVRVSRTIRARADKLFQAWTDPEELKRWWRQEGPGWTFAGASIDLRVGGSFRLAMAAPDGQVHAAVGVYHQIDRPVRLVFSWDWEELASRVGDTLVSVEFREVGSNETKVIVTHERFADPSRMSRHEQGWTELLSLLERAVA